MIDWLADLKDWQIYGAFAGIAVGVMALTVWAVVRPREFASLDDVCETIATLEAPDEYAAWLSDKTVGDPSLAEVTACILAEARKR